MEQMNRDRVGVRGWRFWSILLGSGFWSILLGTCFPGGDKHMGHCCRRLQALGPPRFRGRAMVRVGLHYLIWFCELESELSTCASSRQHGITRVREMPLLLAWMFAVVTTCFRVKVDGRGDMSGAAGACSWGSMSGAAGAV